MSSLDAELSKAAQCDSIVKQFVEDATPPGVISDQEGFPLPVYQDKPEHLPRKVFAQPFRLTFKKTETQEITWIRIESLSGLKKVAEQLSKGELVPIDAFNTLDRQLWGHLAEYLGFIRPDVPFGEFGGGIQPIGGPQAQLADELSELFGGLDPGLEALNQMRRDLLKQRESLEPIVSAGSDCTYVKEDGINLTEEGEKILAQNVGISESEMAADNGELLMEQSSAGPPSEELESIENLPGEGESWTGPDAEIQGRKVEEMGPIGDIPPSDEA